MRWASSHKKLLLLVGKMAWCSEHGVWTVVRRRFVDVVNFVIDIHRAVGGSLPSLDCCQLVLWNRGQLKHALLGTHVPKPSVRISKKLRLTAPL